MGSNTIICVLNSMRMRGPKNRSIRTVYACVCAILAVSVAYPQQTQELGNALDLSKYKLELFYSNDFAKPQDIVFEEKLVRTLANLKQIRTSTPDKRAVWIAEGRGGVDIRDGKLRVS